MVEVSSIAGNMRRIGGGVVLGQEGGDVMEGEEDMVSSDGATSQT